MWWRYREGLLVEAELLLDDKGRIELKGQVDERRV
jgi:hypothetical protein